MDTAPSSNWLLPIGNAPDTVMVLVVIGGQVEIIATNKRIVHHPMAKIHIRKMSWIESWKSDIM
jgi:hypothetical protein